MKIIITNNQQFTERKDLDEYVHSHGETNTNMLLEVGEEEAKVLQVSDSVTVYGAKVKVTRQDAS